MMKHQLDSDPVKAALVIEALEAGKAHRAIARELALTRHAVDSYAIRMKNGGNGKLPPPLRKPPPELNGEKIEELKRSGLPWTYRLIGEFYDLPKKAVEDAHREFQRDRAEEDGSAARKRQIALLGEQIVELRTERRRVALAGTHAEHREISSRVADCERELERQELAQRQFEDEAEQALFRSPVQRRQGLEQGLADATGHVDKHRVEAERLLRQAMASFERMQAFVGVTVAARQELNHLGGPIRHPMVDATPTTFESFVSVWLEKVKGEKDG